MKKKLFVLAGILLSATVCFGAGCFIGYGKGENEVMSLYPLSAAFGEMMVARKLREGCANDALAMLDEKIAMHARQGEEFHSTASNRGRQIYNELMPGLQRYEGQKLNSRLPPDLKSCGTNKNEKK